MGAQRQRGHGDEDRLRARAAWSSSVKIDVDRAPAQMAADARGRLGRERDGTLTRVDAATDDVRTTRSAARCATWRSAPAPLDEQPPHRLLRAGGVTARVWIPALLRPAPAAAGGPSRRRQRVAAGPLETCSQVYTRGAAGRADRLRPAAPGDVRDRRAAGQREPCGSCSRSAGFAPVASASATSRATAPTPRDAVTPAQVPPQRTVVRAAARGGRTSSGRTSRAARGIRLRDPQSGAGARWRPSAPARPTSASLAPGPGSRRAEPARYRPTGRQTFVRLAAPDDLQGRAHAEPRPERGVSAAHTSCTTGSTPTASASPRASATRRAAAGIAVAGFERWDPEASGYGALTRRVERSGADARLPRRLLARTRAR